MLRSLHESFAWSLETCLISFKDCLIYLSFTSELALELREVSKWLTVVCCEVLRSQEKLGQVRLSWLGLSTLVSSSYWPLSHWWLAPSLGICKNSFSLNHHWFLKPKLGFHLPFITFRNLWKFHLHFIFIGFRFHTLFNFM